MNHVQNALELAMENDADATALCRDANYRAIFLLLVPKMGRDGLPSGNGGADSP